MIEDRLREAIEAHRAPDVGKPGWDQIEQRAADARHHAARQRAERRVVMLAASVAAIGVATTAVLRDGDSSVRVVANDPAPTTTAAPATTTSAAAPEPSPAPDPATVDGIYPDRTAYERD
ncbi:MAG: hypothetical protein M3P34_10620, partial [Actinomycetota bacterium]|nr:hypothetical protein [Actinomycetota bacterium]